MRVVKWLMVNKMALDEAEVHGAWESAILSRSECGQIRTGLFGMKGRDTVRESGGTDKEKD